MMIKVKIEMKLVEIERMIVNRKKEIADKDQNHQEGIEEVEVEVIILEEEEEMTEEEVVIEEEEIEVMVVVDVDQC